MYSNPHFEYCDKIFTEIPNVQQVVAMQAGTYADSFYQVLLKKYGAVKDLLYLPYTNNKSLVQTVQFKTSVSIRGCFSLPSLHTGGFSPFLHFRGFSSDIMSCAAVAVLRQQLIPQLTRRSKLESPDSDFTWLPSAHPAATPALHLNQSHSLALACWETLPALLSQSGIKHKHTHIAAHYPDLKM